jgi:Lon-like protease BrxL-like, ATPase domain
MAQRMKHSSLFGGMRIDSESEPPTARTEQAEFWPTRGVALQNTGASSSGTSAGNQDAIKRTAAGFLKLLYPDRTPGTLSREEIWPIIEIAVEMRKRVTDQLGVISPAEFKEVVYTCRVRES